MTELRKNPCCNMFEQRPNPYAKKLKSQVTINLDVTTIDFFKKQAADSGIPYQTLINLYLADCVRNNRQLHLTWS